MRGRPGGCRRVSPGTSAAALRLTLHHMSLTAKGPSDSAICLCLGTYKDDRGARIRALWLKSVHGVNAGAWIGLDFGLTVGAVIRVRG